MAKNGLPKLPDLDTYLAAGFNPKTGLPYKWGQDPCTLKDDIKRVIRVIDEQNAIERFQWINLPDGLDGELLERILYYRGQGMFFYMETTNQFYFLPYALSGSIDCYGRYTGVTPLPFNGSAESKENKPWITGLVRKPVYGIKLPEDIDLSTMTDSCVLLHDYSKQMSQVTIPRQQLNEAIINVEAEMIPLMRTACILGTGVKGMRVNSEDEQAQVLWAAQALEDAALKGQGYVPMIGSIQFQDFTDPGNLKGADYMQAMESIDNFRLGTYGIENGGLFQKKAHMLETEQAMAGGATSMALQNCLSIRERFCDIVNSIWGLGIACIPKDAVMGGDVAQDGLGFNTEENGPDMSGGNEDDSNV